MNRSTIALVFLGAVLAAGIGGYGFGSANGKAAQVANHNAQALSQLGKQLDAHSDLVKRSTTANLALRTTMQARKAVDKQSTEVLTHELNSTADSRAGCVFPASVMRELSTSRDRAAQAASGGVSGAVPGTATGPQER